MASEILRPKDDMTPEERLDWVESEIKKLQSALGGVPSFDVFQNVNFHIFPGGKTPERQTEGAIGFDAYARAIVDPLSKPVEGSPLRRAIGDFRKSREMGAGWIDDIDPAIQDFVADDETDEQKYVVNLPPGERLMVGLGVATQMEFPLFYWVAPRSGYAARGITVANSPGTVDPDYRGEAGALIENNSSEDFTISHQMRVVQLLFGVAFIPTLTRVQNHTDLTATDRGVGGFGSTGKH